MAKFQTQKNRTSIPVKTLTCAPPPGLRTQKKWIQKMTKVQKEAKYSIKRIISQTSSKYQENTMEKGVRKKTSYLKEKNTSQDNRNRRFQQEEARYNRNQYGFGNCSYRNQEDPIEIENERYEYEPSLHRTQSDSFSADGSTVEQPILDQHENQEADQKRLPRLLNLSRKNFNKTIINVLCNKELKFIPVPRSNFSELQEDMKSFCRKLRIMEFYADKPGHNDVSLVKPNSEFTPKRNRDIILDTYCDYLTKLPFNEILQDQNKVNWNEVNRCNLC